MPMRNAAYEIPKKQIVEISPRTGPNVEVVKTQKRKKAKRKRVSSMAQVLFFGGVLVLLMCVVLYVQAQSIALSGEIDKQEEILLLLNSDNEFLTNELEMRTNLKDVEIYATTTLGLVKKDSSQIIYVQRDSISNITVNEGIFVNLLKSVNQNLLNFSEYIAPHE